MSEQSAPSHRHHKKIKFFSNLGLTKSVIPIINR